MRVSLIAGSVAALVLFGIWSQRKPIAEGYVNDELAARGVQARYRIEDLGLSHQRLTNVVIGDPRNPDLTARVIDLNITVGLSGATLHGFNAQGLRVRGRLIDGKLTLGAIDRLLPPPSGAAFTLPDIIAGLSDARMRLETPAGVVGLKLDGAGRLSDGFSGRLAAVSERLDASGCAIADASAWVQVRIADRQPRVTGPIRFARADCGSLTARGGTVNADITLVESLDRWKGQAAVALTSVASGGARLGGINGAIDVDGGTQRTEGHIQLAARDFLMAGNRWPGAGGGGRFRGRRHRPAVRRHRPRPADARRPRIACQHRPMRRAGPAGTPAGPILDRLVAAARRAGGAITGRAALAIEQHQGRGWLALSGLDARSASGARLTLSDGDGLRFGWPGGQPQIDGLATLEGGGFPSATVRLAQAGPGGAISGTALIAPMTGDGARLALQPIDFTAMPGGGTRFSTRVDLSGPLGDGRVDGLALPLSGRVGRRGRAGAQPRLRAARFPPAGDIGAGARSCEAQAVPGFGRHGADCRRAGDRRRADRRTAADRAAGQHAGDAGGGRVRCQYCARAVSPSMGWRRGWARKGG